LLDEGGREGPPLTGEVGASIKDRAMSAEYLIGGVLALLLTAYLVYALLKPERF
jgi:K+-transporting ATPase KdpF subunit